MLLRHRTLLGKLHRMGHAYPYMDPYMEPLLPFSLKVLRVLYAKGWIHVYRDRSRGAPLAYGISDAAKTFFRIENGE